MALPVCQACSASLGSSGQVSSVHWASVCLFLLQSQWKAGYYRDGQRSDRLAEDPGPARGAALSDSPRREAGWGEVEGGWSDESTPVHHLVCGAHDVQVHSRHCPGFGKCLLHGRAGLVRGGGSQF